MSLSVLLDVWRRPDESAPRPSPSTASSLDAAHGPRAAGASTQRFHALDALRAFALLLGVFQHSYLGFVYPPDLWAVGTSTPSLSFGALAYYVHSFRLELFFLMAGFFAALVVGRRGPVAFLKDRVVRILLVFAVLLYPMRVLTDWLWIIGGITTGARPVPPDLAGEPIAGLVLRSLVLDSWPDINTTHLWFLYYLMVISALFLAGRTTFLQMLPRTALAALDSLYHRVLSSWLAPVVVALATTVLLARMRSPLGVDSPDHSLWLHRPVLVLYTFFFSLGWWAHRNEGVLHALARHATVFLPSSIVVGVVSLAAIGTHPGDFGWLARLAGGFGTSLTMSLAVLGWLGLFVRLFARERPSVRYLADSSYFIYIAHWPVVVGMQVGLHHWPASPWSKVLLVNAIALPLLLGVYHVAIRHSWVGTWLNGRRPVRIEQPGTEAESHQPRLPVHSA